MSPKRKEVHLESIPVSDRPYSERQLIVVVSDKVVEAEKKAKADEAVAKQNNNWERVAVNTLAVMGMVGAGATTILAEAAVVAVKAIGKIRDNGMPVLAVGRSEAAGLVFPPGHPRDGVLYIGHPAINSVYYTTAQFHRLTFEHKFSEAICILMSLGAKTISVEYQYGWGKDFAANLSLPLPQQNASVVAKAAVTSKASTHLLFTASLNPKKSPRMPKGIVWYSHEPTWQQIVKGRLEHGLKNFCLILRYEDDFGVNAGLKLAASKAGLELGGSFEDHQATVWKIQGTFGDS